MLNKSEILKTLADLITEAKRHAIGGILYPSDMTGLYRRAAAIHGCTAAEVETLHRARHPSTSIAE